MEIIVPDGGGIASTPAKSLAVPAAYAAVAMIADSVAALPWNSYRGNVPSDPVPPILRRPDPFSGLQRTRRQIATALLLDGNAYCYLTAPGRDGYPTVAIPIPRSEVTVKWNSTRTRPIYRWRGETLVENESIMHIRMLDAPGALRGLGPIEAARISVAGMIEGERLATDGYLNGGVPDGVVTVPGKLTEPEADQIRSGWDKRHAGKRGVAFLTGGMTWTSTRMSNADMQFLESREFSIRDVARLFRIPAALLNAVADGGGITYRNLEGVWTEYTRTAIEPIAERLEEAFSFLIPSTREIRHDYGRLLRADVQTRYNTYAIARQNGILTTNEIRTSEGLDPLPGGDRLDFRAPDTETASDPSIAEVDVDGI